MSSPLFLSSLNQPVLGLLSRSWITSQSAQLSRPTHPTRDGWAGLTSSSERLRALSTGQVPSWRAFQREEQAWPEEMLVEQETDGTEETNRQKQVVQGTMGSRAQERRADPAR